MYQEEHGEGTWLRVQKGDFAVVHSNARHAWRNHSQVPCACFIITGGDVFRYLRGITDFQKEARQQGTSQGEVIRKIFALADETNGWLATPEENAAIGLRLG